MSDLSTLPMQRFEDFYRLLARLRDEVAGAWSDAEPPPPPMPLSAMPLADAGSAGSDVRDLTGEVEPVDRAAGRGPRPGAVDFDPYDTGVMEPSIDAPLDESLSDAPRARRLESPTEDTSRLDTGTIEVESAFGPSARKVWRTLLTALQRQGVEAGDRDGPFQGGLLSEARYAMAALADDIFLHLPWMGAYKWRDHLLEAELFGTHRAGQQVFERIDQLIHRDEAGDRPLAAIYLAALSVGFQGRYRGEPDGPQQLAAYRRRLLRLVAAHEQPILQGEGRLVPQAYQVSTGGGGGVRLPHLTPWLLALVLVVVLWAAVSFPLWYRLTNEVDDLAQEIPIHGSYSPAQGDSG